MRMLLKNKRLLAVVAIVAVILAVALWPERSRSTWPAVERGPMQVTIDEEGETRVRDRFVVSAPVHGRLQRIELEPGDPVVRGKTVVARLTPAAAPLLDPRTRGELAAAVEAARAAVGQAQAERERARRPSLARARSTLRRQRDADQGRRHHRATSSRRRRRGQDRRGSACGPREFAVARAEHELQLARARLQAAERRRPDRRRRRAGRRRRVQAAARERVGRAGRRAAARDRRPASTGNRRRPAVDRRRAGLAGRMPC